MSLVSPDPEPAPRVGIWAALENSAVETELLLARVDQLMATSCILIALWFSTIRPSLGLPLAALCVCMAMVATTTAMLLKRGKLVGIAANGLPVVEMLLPGIALLMMSLIESPGYALASWVPPQMFFLFITMNIFRLRPWLPIAMGALATVEFLGIYGLVIYPEVAQDGVLIHRWDVQLVRGGSLFIIGIAASLSILGLRRMVSRANAEVRSTELFGKYRMLDQVGVGGMGVVHRALYCPEGGFERQVAVKLIHQHLAQDEQLVDRFREEASMSALLAHPNLVGALDFGQVGDTYFFAMEYVDGPTFEEIRKHYQQLGERMPGKLVAHLGIEICQGLNYAHREARDADGQPLRVLHRDLSPMNLMLDRSGRVKLLDFGVARALKEAQSLHTVHLVGKPSYFAPEQLQDHVVDERSDLWSVAVVLWELLCGERLFRRREEHATMLAVVESAVPMPSLARNDLPAAWDRFFERALEREPGARFQSAFQMGEALREIAREHEPVDAADLAALARLETVDLELELDP